MSNVGAPPADAASAGYIHGRSVVEQERLRALNSLTNRSFIDYMALRGDEAVGDFGCGLGQLAHDIASRYPCVQLTGIEKSEEYCAVARRRTAVHPGVTIRCADALAGGLLSASFDVTYCRYFLEHVRSAADAAREMIRVTKPGGRIVVQENDLHNVLYEPEIPGHALVRQAYCRLQAQLGGDPYVGRKLFTLFDVEAVARIELSLAPELYTAREPDAYRAWIGNSLRILATARDALVETGAVPADLVDSVLAEMDRRRHRPVGAALFHWNRLTAWKRDGEAHALRGEP